MPLQFLSPIHKASRQIEMFLEPLIARSGVSTVEGHIIAYLDAYGPCPIGELHRVFGHRRSTLTSILDRLETKGAVKRTLNRQDRRSFLVELSRVGRRLAGRIKGPVDQLEAAIRAKTSKSDIRGFMRVLAAIEEVTQVEVRVRRDP